MNMPVQDNVLQNNEPSITHSHDAGAAFGEHSRIEHGADAAPPAASLWADDAIALNYGLNAYSLWRCFPFPESAARFFERLMGDVPPEFAIRDLQQPPVAYQKSRRAEPGTRSFGEALKIAMKLRPAVT